MTHARMPPSQARRADIPPPKQKPTDPIRSGTTNRWSRRYATAATRSFVSRSFGRPPISWRTVGATIARSSAGSFASSPSTKTGSRRGRRNMNRMASRTPPELETMAREKVPRTTFDYIAGGAEDEVSLRRNREAYDKWALRPRILTDVSKRDTRAVVLGERVTMPILAAPTSFHALVHP